MGDFTHQLEELKDLLLSCANINSKSNKSSVYSTLLQLQEHSTTDPSLLQSLADLSHVLLSSMAIDIADDDEEIAAQAMKCLGFMIYHPSIVTSISGDDANVVLSSLQKVILATRIKSVCNLGVWCISVQQFSVSFLIAHTDSLVRAIIYALDNPAGSLSTTFEAIQAVMKLATQLNEKMRETSYLWAPPIYRRLVSAHKREKDMAERCLIKIKSVICPPPIALSKAVVEDIKRKLLSSMEELLKQGLKIQVIQAWGWFIQLIGPYAVKNRQLINQLLKIPEQTFPDSDPQVQIASQIAWQALIDALIILPTQESITKAHNNIIKPNGLTKSLKLIMTPLIGIMSSKCDLSVHLSCLNTWNYLLLRLDISINHPSVLETVFDPFLKTVFQVGPVNQNTSSWNFCLDIIDNHALARRSDIKWSPWNLDRLDFFVKTVHVFINHGPVGYDSALRVFRSAMKGVELNLKSSNVPFNDIMSCINNIITCLKTISEGDNIGQTFLDFIKIVTEELHPSILGSPLYKVNMVSPVAHLIIVYFNAVINLTSDPSLKQLSGYVNLLLGLYDWYNIIDMLTCLLHKILIADCLNLWIIIANCMKNYAGGNKDRDESWFLVISRFLAYPFVVFSSMSQKKIDFVEITEAWKSIYVSVNQGYGCLCENLFPVFDRFLEDYLNVDDMEKNTVCEVLSFCGDAVICVLEHIIKLDPCQRNNVDGEFMRFDCTKNGLRVSSRFLSASYAGSKSNPQILDTTARVFSVLVRFVEFSQFEDDIIPFVEIISNPLLEWLSSSELQHRNTIYQLQQLWIATLKSLQTSWPPINFDSTLLEQQATLLKASLDHPNSSISSTTIAFWNSTFAKHANLKYPQNLLPVLDKLSRTGKINICKKQYFRVSTTLNRCVKRVELMDDKTGSKRKKLELTERQKEVRRAQQGKSKDCEGRGPGVRTYTSVDFSQGNEDESQEESQEIRNADFILEMLKTDGK